jgi:hypothetical protein
VPDTTYGIPIWQPAGATTAPTRRADTRRRRLVIYLSVALGACGPVDRPSPSPDPVYAPATTAAAPAEASDSGFARVPDSTWVTLTGTTIVAFHPVASNDSLERDAGLATALDDLAFHLGSAMDSLVAMRVSVQYRGGDTLWLRHGSWRLRFIRAADSATVGYVLADTLGRWGVLYGVRSDVDLVQDAREFARTGTSVPR